ncbi:MAG: glycosyltransferase family 39 protein [Candidatus Aminicenantes bacterium]|jgi:4-amino-4-deoxy-L-arabinose transferase-like glycosyltransferase
MKSKWLPAAKLKTVIDQADARWLMLIFPLLYLLVFFITSLLRVGFPYQLSWLEGVLMDHSRWILQGNQLYGPPAVEFTPFLYPPLYSYLSAFFMKIFGVHILIPRLLSLVSSLLVLVLLWRLVKYETGSNFYALVAAGFYASFYPFVRCYFDMVRVDAVFVFLLFLGVYILRTAKKPYLIYLSAFVFYLAVFTKQQALPVAGMMGLFLLLHDFKKFLKFTLTFCLLSVITILYFQQASQGWFLFYVYKFPLSHGFRSHLVTLIFKDLFLHAPVLVLMGPYLFFKAFKGKKDLRSRFIFYLFFFIAAFGISWSSRAHAGGVENVLMPILLCLSLLGAVSFWYFEQDIGASNKKGVYFAFLLIGLHFLILIYNPSSLIPSKEHYQWNKKFVDLIASFEGDVLVTQIGYIPTLAGKKTFAHMTAVNFAYSPGDVSAKAKRIINRKFRKAIRRKQFSAIILRKNESFFLSKMRGVYKWKGRFVTPIPLVLHGVMHQDWEIYVPK